VSSNPAVTLEAMVRRFKPYPAYKDSGVEWLGMIPAHWEVRRLKHVAPIRVTRLSERPDGVPYVGLEHIEPWTGRVSLDIQPEGVDSVVGSFSAGDVLFGKLRPYLAKAARPDFAGVCSSEVVVFAPSPSCTQGYLFYCFVSKPFVEWADSFTYGTKMPRVNPEQLGNSRVPLPPEPEQRAITAFLDREIARIDSLIAKKERLLEVLQERRVALITHAVTKGLDPNAPMKDSGIQWLGDIPAHWSLAPVYSRYDVQLGKMLDSKRNRGQFPGQYLRNVDVQWDAINTKDLPQMDFSPFERERYRLRPGDLLVCEGGEIGRTAIWRGEIEECFYQKALHRLRPRSETEVPRFFYYLMYALAKGGVFAAGANPNTIDHLTAVQLRHYRLPFPPTAEKRSIAAYLDEETGKIDSRVGSAREAIDRLKEFRAALISAAVTGQIDVREEVA